MNNFAEILEDIDNMPIDSQEIFIDILNKRLTEKKREKFILSTLESKKEYDSGNYTKGNSEDLFNALNI